MDRAKAICQEFCEEVSVVSEIRNDSLTLYRTIEKLEVRLERKYFTELLNRMANAGYCCTQTETFAGSVNAKFEPATKDK